jgi:AcrR family transcriptional regulator
MSYSARDKIIQAALELFSNEGYKGTTTKGIALAAGVNESTVFRIFGSKDNLFKELLFQNNQLLKIIDLLKSSGLDDAPDTQLLTIANLYKQMYTEHPNASKILYQCAVSSNEVEYINHMIGENAYRYLTAYLLSCRRTGASFCSQRRKKRLFIF